MAGSHHPIKETIVSETQPELMTLAQTIAEELNAIDDHTWTAANA